MAKRGRFTKKAIKTIVCILLALVVVSGAFLLTFPVKHLKDFQAACKEYDVSLSLALSVARCESRFDPSKVSPKGAVGVMQLMPSTASWCCEKLGLPYDENSLFDPKVNVWLGVYYLSYLQSRFSFVDDVIMAYNAGEGNVRKWKDSGEAPFPETQAYLKRVKLSCRFYDLIL